jgi:hypothetical protein
MAPGHIRLILVREMNVLEHVQLRFLIFRSLYRQRAVQRLGSGVCTFQPTSASGNPYPNTFERQEGRGSVMCDARFYVSKGEHP